jgi:hypothetical protein
VNVDPTLQRAGGCRTKFRRVSRARDSRLPGTAIGLQRREIRRTPKSAPEPTCAFKPLRGELVYLLFDLGVVCVVGRVGEKSRRLLVIAGREVVARLHHEGLDIGVIDEVWLDHVASSRCRRSAWRAAPRGKKKGAGRPGPLLSVWLSP